MMGRQFSLFLIGDDETIIWRALPEVGPFSLYRTCSRTKLQPIKIPVNAPDTSTGLRSMWLAVAPQDFGAHIVEEHIKGDYILNKQDGEVMEFTRARLIDTETHWGPAPVKP